MYHLEITPSDVGNYDRVVIQDLLKEVAQTQQVDLGAKQRFKVVVINEADGLSRDAQAALRRTMEKYSANVRLILVATSTAGIIAPIRSRTLLVRVPAPTETQIVDVLNSAIKREAGWTVVPELNARIAASSGRNLRKALLVLEAVYASSPSPGPNTALPPADWELLISTIAHDILRERTPSMILATRAKLYDLLTHCIPASVVLKTLAMKLCTECPELPDHLKPEVVKWASFYEHRVKLGSKVIFHLEAFVAKVMRVFEMDLGGMDF